MKRSSAALLPLLALAACTSVDDPFLNATASKTGAPTLATSVPARQAVASLPGRVPTEVRQTAAGKSTSQIILYPNATQQAGENMLSITIAASGSDAAVTKAPTRSEIEAELSEAIPGVAMRIDTTVRDNAYGSFGMATGRLGAGGACLYAWQAVRRLPAEAVGASSGFGRSPSARIRLRTCDPAASAESLATLMQGLRIDAAGDPALAAASPAVVQSLEARVIEPVVVNDAPARRHARILRREPAAPAAEATPAIPASAAKVPLPGEAAKPVVATAPVAPAPAVVTVPAAVQAPPAPAASVKVPLPGG